MNGIKTIYEPLRKLGFALIGAGWTEIQDMAGNPTATNHPARIYTILNNTDKDLLFSWDNTDPFVLIPTLRSFTEDLCTNQTSTDGAYLLAKGSKLYVKHNGAGPTSGSIYLTICYGEEY